ncbi:MULTISPECIES: thioredoxin family protein [unclassified Mesobacillus]|uniref:thioredoxin family protein n=1 Tax=unclassified Mesobacillus TaxID=2675270 RepID=UPI00203B1620|nr:MULTISPECIES: thioredoxin family protein [unclassified Mesobacillus]MCM3125408.1 thioredoxin family protein [Mesobacillus sp. MER 33]MCM3235547.1 thioredoxin family protein [Mesobacillus sp. MER 48]
MIIKVLGTGCKKSKVLEENINLAIDEAGVAAIVEKVEDGKEIEKYAVDCTPAVVIDENVVSAGKQLTAEEIKKLF